MARPTSLFLMALMFLATGLFGQTNAATVGAAPAAAKATNAVADSASQTNADATVQNTYLLRPQDKVTFRIEEDPVKSADSDTLVVSALGEIYVPVSRGFDDRLIIMANGKTVSQLTQEVEAKLQADYYKKATVRMSLIDQGRRQGQALFMGSIQGSVPLPPGEIITLGEAVVRLGGAKEFANLKKVELHRIDPETKTEIKPVQIINVDAILKGDRSKDIPLQDGDRIVVPERKFIF